MKKILLGLLFLPIIGFSQDKLTIPNPFVYELMDSIPGVSSTNLYSRSKIFIAEKFKNSKYITQLDDPASNTLIIQGARFRPYLKGAGTFGSKGYWGDVTFDIKIQTKDGKFKITMNNFYHTNKYNETKMPYGGDLNNEKPASGTMFMSKKGFMAIKEFTADESEKMLAEFKIRLAKSEEF